MNLATCRHNSSHKIKRSRLEIHEDKCPDRNKYPLLPCPYNPYHKIAEMNYSGHVSFCPDKPQITQEDEEKLREHLKEKAKKNPKTLVFTSNWNKNVSFGTADCSRNGLSDMIDESASNKELFIEIKEAKNEIKDDKEMMNETKQGIHEIIEEVNNALDIIQENQNEENEIIELIDKCEQKSENCKEEEDEFEKNYVNISLEDLQNMVF